MSTDPRRRSEAAIRIGIARAMERQVTAEWLVPRLETAVRAKNLDEVEILIDLAGDHHVTVPETLLERALVLSASSQGTGARVADCARCAVDITACDRLSDIAACALPFEMSPLGDANALRRAGGDWAAGREVDHLDAGLALAGLSATGLAVATGGSSLTVKAGATVLRVARHMGAVTPGFTRVLRVMSDIRIDWARVPDYLGGTVPLGTVTDTAKLAALGALAGDIGAIRRSTSTAETLVLLRHVDSAGDAARLARVTTVTGPRTRHVIYALGKSRALRSAVRFSDLALATMGLFSALMLQIPALISEAVRRAIRPGKRRVA
ncbi:MAG: hypothetical protein HUJ27_09685 [Rhodobacteraceae bacterium]|nr:hypothetical protein [Paracoccaceae bacterium]